MNTSKKKVLFVITKGNFGGAQRYVFDLATNLPEESFEAVVACGPGSLLIERLKDSKIKTIQIETLEREVRLKNDFKTCRQLVKIIKEERPDIVHLNSSKIGLLGALAVLYLKIFNFQSFNFKSVFTSHGWAFNEKNRSRASRLVFYFAHYFTVLVCDATIAVSEQTKKDIGWLPFIKNKIRVVHNGTGNFKLLTKKVAAEILVRNSPTQKILFSLSELHPNKGLDVAFKAIAMLQPEIRAKIRYYIAGSGEELSKLEKLADSLGIRDCIKMLGFVENAKSLLSGADIFLFPSRTENLPYALLEAGAVGLPIIATSVGGIPEIIHDMQNGILVHKENQKEIAEAITYLLEHKEKQKEFCENIRQTVKNDFSLQKMLEKTTIIYSKLLA